MEEHSCVGVMQQSAPVPCGATDQLQHINCNKSLARCQRGLTPPQWYNTVFTLLIILPKEQPRAHKQTKKVTVESVEFLWTHYQALQRQINSSWPQTELHSSWSKRLFHHVRTSSFYDCVRFLGAGSFRPNQSLLIMAMPVSCGIQRHQHNDELKD